MVTKQDFTPDEWVKILQSTMVAGMAIYAAEPSGFWGVLKEASASSSAIAAGKSSGGSSSLMKAVAEELETKEGRTTVQEAVLRDFKDAKPSETVRRCLAMLIEVTRIIDTKAPQESAAFKAWLRSISQAVAEASSEGGFLGIGSVKVSDAEKATLADISKVLGTRT